jgi:hypothetical protein
MLRTLIRWTPKARKCEEKIAVLVWRTRNALLRSCHLNQGLKEVREGAWQIAGK